MDRIENKQMVSSWIKNTCLWFSLLALLAVSVPVSVSAQRFHGAVSSNSAKYSVAYSPLDLGSKLLYWGHGNDAAVVTESGGLISALEDKGTGGIDLTAEGTTNPSISDGEITFDGVDQSLYATGITLPTGAAEMFAVAKHTGTSNFSFGFGDSDFTSAVYLDLRYYDAITKAGMHFRETGNFERSHADVDVGTGFVVWGVRSTGTAYIINVNGTDYEFANQTQHTGQGDGSWFGDQPGAIDNFTIGKTLVSGTDSYFDGAIGKAGVIVTQALTDQERSDLIDWMLAESGITP